MTATFNTSDLRCVWDGKAELGEGVIWHPVEMAVYWVDIVQSNLHRLSADGATNYWHFPGQLSSVVPCHSGGLLATFEDGLSHIDLETATVTSLTPLESDLPDNRFNDGASDALGQFWFGSMDSNEQDMSGRFYRMDLNGGVTCVESFPTVCISNGPAFSADGNWIYFTDTLGKIIYRAGILPDGSPGKPGTYLTLGDQDGYPDGMCTDTEGGLWVCHFAGGRVTRFLEDGTADQVINLPVPNITKCTFGGPDLRTLYITTAAKSLTEAERLAHPLSGGLFAIELDHQGWSTKPVARASGNIY